MAIPNAQPWRILLMKLVFFSILHVDALWISSTHTRNSEATDHRQKLRKATILSSFAIHERTHSVLSSARQSVELDNEEPMSVYFQRALILQRSGSIEAALEQYQLFCKAAEQCQVDTSQYAEVHVNIGAIFLRQGHRDRARHHFEAALENRSIGTAHVNLAVLKLQQATSTATSRDAAIQCLQTAKDHCQRTVELNDDPRSRETATRLLGDVEEMLRQIGEG